MNSGGIGAVLCGAADRLAQLLGLLHPLAGYRVYDVEHTELMGSICSLEMRKDLLDDD